MEAGATYRVAGLPGAAADAVFSGNQWSLNPLILIPLFFEIN